MAVLELLLLLECPTSWQTLCRVQCTGSVNNETLVALLELLLLLECQTSQQTPYHVATGPVNQETLVAVLELLQWRQGILEEHTLAQPLSALLGRLLDIATQASSGAPGAVDGQGPDAVGQSAAHTAEASFLAQLVLSALRALSERADAVLLVKVQLL